MDGLVVDELGKLQLTRVLLLEKVFFGLLDELFVLFAEYGRRGGLVRRGRRGGGRAS